MDPLLLVGSIIVLAAMLTWILPAGSFKRVRDAGTGRTMVVPNSFKAVASNPVGAWDALQAIPKGLVEASEVVFFVLLAGGALTVIEATGAIGNFLNFVMWRFGRSPLLVLAIASSLFLIGGASNNMYEEILAFIPVLCLLMRRLGLDAVTAVALSVGTATVAACFSPFNTFLLGISQPIAELPLFSGFGFRLVFFVAAMAIWGAYLAWYATRNRTAMADAVPEQAPANWGARDVRVLIVMNAGMALIVAGGLFLHWELRQFSVVFVLMGFLAGLAGGLGWRGSSEGFAEGFRRMAVASILVGLARAISVVLSQGLVLDTIANALFSPLRHLPLSISAVMMVLSENLLAFPMPSDSGRALMSLPVILPLSDLLGLSRQMTISAYTSSSLVAGLVTPTSGALLAILAVAEVPFGKWLRFIAVPFGLLLALAAVAIVVGVQLGIQ